MTRKIYIIVSFLFFIVLFHSLGLYALNSEEYVRPRILRLAKKLSKSETLHLGYPVGIAGVPETKNKYYKRYLKLEKLATDSELVILTKHKSTNVVIYAFNALSSRGYKNLQQIFLNHINDTAYFSIDAGCTGSFGQVNSYMLNYLKPGLYKGQINYITEEEYQRYLKLITK